MAVAANGRLWATWYAGPTPSEDQNNYVVLSTSGDHGLTWEETLVVDPDGAGLVRAFDPELWIAPNGQLYVFWAQTFDHTGTTGGVWCVTTSTPQNAHPIWQPPRRLTDGVMMCKPLVLSTGEWALPASTWNETDFSARMIVSTNQGETWSLRGAANVPSAVRTFDEHMIIERAEGSLWMLIRTTYGIGESISHDTGRTWTETTPSAIAHPSARFFIRRLSSGNLLLVKHGSVALKTSRSELTAFISEDHGITWKGGLLLDERTGVSYPDGQQAEDGLIHIIYDYNRTTDRQILRAVFREEDAAAGQALSSSVCLRQIISSYTPAPIESNRSGARLNQEEWGTLSAEGSIALPFMIGAQLFSNAPYTVQELPLALSDAPPSQHRARFLQLAMNESALLTCTRSGMVYLLTPSPSRDPVTSQSHALMTQGFSKTRLPEVRILSTQATSTFCTVYQKRCVAGEIIRIGPWAIPFFFY